MAFMNSSRGVMIGEIEFSISFIEAAIEYHDIIKDILEFIAKGVYETTKYDLLLHSPETESQMPSKFEETDYKNSDCNFDILDFRHPYKFLKNVSFLSN